MNFHVLFIIEYCHIFDMDQSIKTLDTKNKYTVYSLTPCILILAAYEDSILMVSGVSDVGGREGHCGRFVRQSFLEHFRGLWKKISMKSKL